MLVEGSVATHVLVRYQERREKAPMVFGCAMGINATALKGLTVWNVIKSFWLEPAENTAVIARNVLVEGLVKPARVKHAGMKELLVSILSPTTIKETKALVLRGRR